MNSFTKTPVLLTPIWANETFALYYGDEGASVKHVDE